MLRTIRTTIAATLAAATFLGAASLAAQAGQDFTVYNDSNRDIHLLFISPDYSRNWGRDMLAGRVVPAGGSADIELNSFGDHCVFDIKVEVSSGDVDELYGVDLCYYDGVSIN